jgi:uncharacterized phage protein (TIGR01671 family)
MNREFKFRVWDSEEERFIEWYNADPYIACSTGHIMCHERTRNPDGSYGADKMSNKRHFEGKLIVQQYTGLIDQTSNEICEGDIVSVYDDKNRYIIRYGKSVRTVISYDGKSINSLEFNGFYFQSIYDGKPYQSITKNHHGVHDLNGTKILGNIYETPELVKCNNSLPLETLNFFT